MQCLCLIVVLVVMLVWLVHYCLVRFIKSRPNMSQLLENLLHFQHFQQFINGRIQRKKGAFGINRDRFDEAVSLWEDSKQRDHKMY